MKQEKCFPLELLKRKMKEKSFALVLEHIQEADHPLIFATYADIAEQYPKERAALFRNNPSVIGTDINLIEALSGWRPSKQIYRFDPEFWNLLTENTDFGLRIPVEILYRIPYKTVWIEPLNAFVYFDAGYTENSVELKVLKFFDKTNCLQLIMKLVPGRTVLECLQITVRETMKYSNPDPAQKKLLEEGLEEAPEALCAVNKPLLDALQALLYICAENSDIKENPKQKTIYKKPADKPKDQFREIRMWDAGSIIIRNMKKASAQHDLVSDLPSAPKQSSSGWVVRPHMRRAHWHHYWTGKRDGKRTLILKWVAPSFVNADSGESPATINKVNP